jgi:hypothetical protein
VVQKELKAAEIVLLRTTLPKSNEGGLNQEVGWVGRHAPLGVRVGGPRMDHKVL